MGNVMAIRKGDIQLYMTVSWLDFAVTMKKKEAYFTLALNAGTLMGFGNSSLNCLVMLVLSLPMGNELFMSTCLLYCAHRRVQKDLIRCLDQ